MDANHNVGRRLKAFREKTKIKMPAISLATGIAKETLYKWEKGTRPSDLNDYFKLQTYLDEQENKVSEELFIEESNKPSTLWLPFDPNITPVTKTDNKASAGTVCMLNGKLGIIVDRINAPILGLIDGVVEVTGESMAPTFPNGCRIGIVRINRKMLQWGQYYYIIDTNYKGFVRRICPDKEPSSIMLLSDHINQNLFPPMSRLKENIIGILQIVVAIIKQ